MDTDDLAQRPWILLGGTLCTPGVFDGMLDTLGVPAANGRHVILDRPKVEDYASDFEEMPDGSIVCGFSLGAIVAAHFADRMMAHQLILFGVNPFADDPDNAERRHDLEKDVRTLGGSGALMARAPSFFGPAPDQTRAVVYKMADAAAEMICPQTRLALSRPGAIPALAGASMPVLALTGEQDKSAPPNYGMAAAQAAPYGQFVALGSLGHFALLEDPQACATAILQSEKAHQT